VNNEKPIPYHTLPPEEVLKLLETTMGGLPSSQVQERLERFGYNELAAAPGISPLRIFFRQFKNLLIVILLIATAISFLLGEHLDAWVILGILAACAILGFYQEYTAEQAALALKKMAAPTATVIREGKEAMIPTREVAPGDILALHAGDRVAADGRLLSQFNLMADEAALTGESTPVAKKTNPLTQAEAPLGDRFCMVFGGTVITYGRGLAVVTATGMNSEFGRIARILAEVEEKKTPLEARMDTIGRVLSVIALAVAAAASILGVFRGHSWLEMLIWGISLAVAAVPEALPAVVTGALSIGTTRMARRNAIVKRLPAVETMGCITVICTDKTGTLTRNEMVARRVFLEGRDWKSLATVMNRRVYSWKMVGNWPRIPMRSSSRRPASRFSATMRLWKKKAASGSSGVTPPKARSWPWAARAALTRLNLPPSCPGWGKSPLPQSAR